MPCQFKFVHTKFLFDKCGKAIRSHTVCDNSCSRMLGSMIKRKQIKKYTEKCKLEKLPDLANNKSLTSSRTIAAIKAIKRFRLNSRPVESTAADLEESHQCSFKKFKLQSQWNWLIRSHYLSTSVSKIIPRSALLSRTALVIAFIAVLSSGLGIWFGNKPEYRNHCYSKSKYNA